MNAYVHTVIMIVFAALMVGCEGKANYLSLKRTEREAIITAANQAVHKHMISIPSEQRTAEIPRSLWGKAIEQLHPLRVLNDRVNVFIVTQEDDTTEEGLYVSTIISSYAPGLDKRFLVFKKLTEPSDKSSGQLYQCKLKKLQHRASSHAISQRP